MESKYHSFAKENHLNRTSIGKGSMWIFQGVGDPKQVPQSHNKAKWKDSREALLNKFEQSRALSLDILF